MKLKDVFNFDNERYAPLREPSREVVRRFQDAARIFDAVQEFVYIEKGLVHCARVIHNQAHTFPQRFDVFGDMLHERHLMVEYPATAEFDWRAELKGKGMDEVFEVLIDTLQNIQEALESFHKVTDNADFRPMALKTEELMLQNSQDYTKFLEIFAMYDNAVSASSFDSWCRQYLDGEVG